MTDNEVWEDIPGFDGYQASTDGRIRSFLQQGTGTRNNKPHILKADGKEENYAIVKISSSGGFKVKRVHVLILETFAGSRPNGFHACHYDGNKRNNKIDNLRWDTPQANSQDMVRHNRLGLDGREWNIEFLSRVASVQRNILRAYLVSQMLDEFRGTKGATLRAIAEKYGFCESYLSLLVNGKRMPTHYR